MNVSMRVINVYVLKYLLTENLELLYWFDTRVSKCNSPYRSILVPHTHTLRICIVIVPVPARINQSI